MTDLGVTAATGATTGMNLARTKVLGTRSDATAIGTLKSDQSSLGVMSTLNKASSGTYYSFTFSGDESIKMDVTNNTGTAEIRAQLLDAVGNVIADSNGTPTQKLVYSKLTSSEGYAGVSGQYFVKISYADTQQTAAQNYSLNLYSGTTYAESVVTTALTQSYDPNLFKKAADTVNASISAKTYEKSATLAQGSKYDSDKVTDIGHVVKNKTELNVVSALTTTQRDSFYHFTADQKNPIKMTFANTTNDSPMRVQILDSTGKKVIADNKGTEAQKIAYQKLTSGAGLAVNSGDYVMHVSYSGVIGDSAQINYNFQLSSGSRYDEVYSTKAKVVTKAASDDKYEVGKNLNVFSDTDAEIFSSTDYNVINATPDDSIFSGWLKKNSTALSMYSRLTNVNSYAYFRFTFQEGGDMRLSVKNTTDDRALHVIVMDSTGSRVLADNQGTKEQKARFEELTSEKGLEQSAGDYLIQVSHGQGVKMGRQLDYNLQLYSGYTYTSLYKTTASAQSYSNYNLSKGYSAANALNEMLYGNTSTFA